jgi:acetyltransferase-like isoleucine patch superfamily enzyme
MNHVFADPDRPIRLQGETAKGIRIGRDVWLGNGVRVTDGVEIGDGCVIGAGSVVTRSIPPYSIAVGSPARVIRQRR